MSVEVYIFDLDGVIINSGEDIADGVNAALKQFGYWSVGKERIISFIGDGEKNLILRSLKASTKKKFDETTEYGSKQLNSVRQFYHEYYAKNPVVHTYLYAGIKELLKVLKAKNKKNILVTNKPSDIAGLILKKLEVFDYFDIITGGDTLNFQGKTVAVKPDPEGLILSLDRLNQKCNSQFKNENCIFFGDSPTDIQAGKAFGCLTAAIRGGLSDKNLLSPEKADFSFSVASEIEKFIDTLSKDVQKSELKSQALKNEIPIIQDEGSDFICSYIKEHNVKSIFEIGTAIAYSSIRFAKLSPDIKVTTIEIDRERFEAAQKNIEESGVKDQITSIFGNALEEKINGNFDLIFIDAAKAQYINFFEKFKNQLNPDGVFISDNLSFHGMVEDLSLTRNYSTIKLVKKIRKYIEFLKNNEEFETQFYSVGDGISVSRRKNKTLAESVSTVAQKASDD